MNERKDSRVDRLLSRLVTPGRLGLSEENKKGGAPYLATRVDFSFDSLMGTNLSSTFLMDKERATGLGCGRKGRNK